jgi:hypothetical protein
VEQPDGNAGELDDADVAVDPAGVLGRFDVPDRRADDPVPREGVDGLGKRGIGGDLHELVAGEGVREGRDGDAVEAAVEPVAAAELALLVEAVPDVLHAHAQLRLGAPRPRARLRLRPLLLPRTRRLHGSLPPLSFFLLYRPTTRTLPCSLPVLVLCSSWSLFVSIPPLASRARISDWSLLRFRGSTRGPAGASQPGS